MSLAVLADHMASKGRGPDSMLIHMSPREVQGLQALAVKNGGTLTINPETGLPEAGFLDKLLPTIIGAGISFFSSGAIDPMTAAAMVGGVETARTGDIGKGISAGLGAYGGASLTAGMSAAGADAISTPAAGDAYASLGANAITDAQALAQGFGSAEELMQTRAALAGQEAVTAAGPFESLSKGFDVAKKAGPMQYLKANAIPLAGAFGPAILAGMSAEENMPKTTTGMISPYTFDPYSGTYTAANPYQATPTRAAGGGLMGLANGGMAGYEDDEEGMATGGMGGMFNFAQKSEPVVRMAEGGYVQRFAIGDLVKADIDKAYAAGDYGKVNELAQTNKITAADVADTYKGFDTSGLAGLGVNLYTPPAAPTYTQYTPEQIGSYLTTNPTADIAAATKTTNADPAAVNAYLASIADPFRGSTDTTGGSGVLGIYNQMTAQGIDPTELYKAEIANDPKYAGYTQPMIQKAYNLSKGAYSLSDAKKGVVTDKDWVKFMDDNKYSIDDAAQAFGLSRNEVKSRYDAVKAAEKVVTKDTVTGGTGNDTIRGGTGNDTITYNTAGTNAPGGLESVLGLPPGVSGAGITTVNPNGTITTRPDLSLGMSTVRDDYVRGGGNLGYTSPTFASLKAVEDKYPLKGGSKQSYDFLTGKTDYDPIPYTKTGEIMKPYSSSVLGIPAASAKQMYVFKNGKYEINPDYAIPTYDKDGKKSLNLTNQDVINYVKSPEYSNDDTFVSWMTANNLSPEQVAAATGMSIADVYKKIKKAKPVDAVVDTPVTGQNDGGGGGDMADGGLAAMARGGMAQQFNLGDYSDGGRLLRGPGDGVSDSIPASIGGKRPARLADGEFVVPARIVSELGNGSTEAGARKLYAMMDRIQKARRGTVGKGRVAKNSRSEKYLPA